MSYTTEIIIPVFASELLVLDQPVHPTPAAIERLNEWLKQAGHESLYELDSSGAPFIHLFGTPVFIGSYNHLDEEAFLAVFRAAPWELAECAQVLLKHEEDDGFRLFSAATTG